METETDDARALMLDGNAVAGELQALFGVEMSSDGAECLSCGQTHAMGELLAFTGGPGIVLRCPSCMAVMLAIVRTPHETRLDLRGVAMLKMPPR